MTAKVGCEQLAPLKDEKEEKGCSGDGKCRGRHRKGRRGDGECANRRSSTSSAHDSPAQTSQMFP